MLDSRNTILIVEDDPCTAQLTGCVAETVGYRPIYTDTVCAAKSMLRNMGFCGIVVDIKLPDGNGIELCRWIRSFDTQTPILIHSGTTISHEEALESGADDFLPKGGDPVHLQDALRHLAPQH